MVDRDQFSSPLRLAIGAGLLLSGTTLLFFLYLEGFELGRLFVTGFEGMWIFGGMFLLGAIPAYVSARYRLFTPVLMAVGSYFFFLISDAESIIESRQRTGAGLTPTGFDFFVFFWPLTILVALLFGAIEYKVRDFISRHRTRSSNDE